LWLGTMAGLFFFDYKEFKRIRPDILDSQVASFVELDSSRLFMGINKGLALLDLEAFYNDSETNVKILNASNGFLGFDCIRNGILKDSDGNIWVAASDRVVKFYPDRLEQDTVPPAIVVTDLLATGLYSDYPTSFQHQANTDTIFELPYYLKNIRFNFHSIHFYAPEEISYKYKLAGYDENWSSPSNERYASYTNLAPGKYTFEVLAQNIDGIWSRQPAQIRFEIIPAFWQTFAFKMAINLLVIAIILTTIFLTMWILRLRKRKREETEKQISELQLKTIKSQMDPHFTFNALNSISSVIYKENKEKAYRYFTKFSKLVRASLEVSDKITRTLQEEVDFTRNYLDLEKIRFRDKFEFTINIDPKVNRELLVPKMVIQNYAENAVKHGLKYLEVNRQLKIAIDQIADHLQIMVEDNGVGRKQAQELKGFSTGKGLAIMNNIYDLYFKLYKIKIEQTIEDIYDSYGIPGGTKVIITIPISRK
ncbi:MAG: histidine kinase, partial [Bacteroidales bacterium]|nr:histidine kinase [Bacteroidales bacterium]